MKNEANYIQAGYRFEKAKTKEITDNIKEWLRKEMQQNMDLKDQILRLFEQGRSEGRSA
jgi:serine/threonine-protein kinase RIO1